MAIPCIFGGDWSRHHVIKSELVGWGSQRRRCGLGNRTVTTVALFARAHSLHNSNFTLQFFAA